MNKTTRLTTLAALVGTMFAGAPAQAAGSGWTHQFYVGVHAGSVDGDGTKYDAVGNHPDVGSSSYGDDSRRTNIGVLGGVNFRNGPWLVGVEADFGSMTQDEMEKGLCSIYSLSLCETQYNYHVRARLGYAITDKIDLFVAAGYAGIRAEMYNLLESYDETMHGYTIGAGADVSVMERGVLRIEVLQDNYDGEEFGPSNYGMDDWEDLTIRAAAIFKF